MKRRDWLVLLALAVLGLVGVYLVGQAVGKKAGREAGREAARLLSEDLRRNAIDGCNRNVRDRRVHRNESLANKVGNQTVANDPAQPPRTRAARAAQARANMRSVLSYEARMPRKYRRTSAGKKLPEFTCESAFAAR